MQESTSETTLQQRCSQLERELAMYRKIRQLYNIDFMAETRRICPAG
jgi:hypothetical protein